MSTGWKEVKVSGITTSKFDPKTGELLIATLKKEDNIQVTFDKSVTKELRAFCRALDELEESGEL